MTTNSFPGNSVEIDAAKAASWAWKGRLSWSRQGSSGHLIAWQGRSKQAELSLAGLVWARRGRRGEATSVVALHCTAGQGEAGAEELGLLWLVLSRHGLAGEVQLVEARHGNALRV